MHMLIKLNDWLGKRMFILAIIGMVLGVIIPIPDSPSLRVVVIALFAYMTFITALGTSFKKFVKIVRKPVIPVVILVLVHLVFPFVAWCMGSIFYPDEPVIRLGYLIGASIPIGVSSIIWSAIGNANVAISIVAVTLDTLIVPFFLPLYFKFVIGQTVAINYTKMVYDMLLMITVPSLLGMIIQDVSNGRVNTFQKSVGGVTSKIGWFVMVIINSSFVLPQIGFNLGMIKIALTTLLIAIIGYVVGYGASLGLPSRSRDIELSMMYNVGMRNNAFGIVLALAYFPAAAAAPLTLLMLYQHPLAALATAIYSFKERHMAGSPS